MADIKTISGSTYIPELPEREKMHAEIMDFYRNMNEFDAHSDIMECFKVSAKFPGRAFGVLQCDRKYALEDPFSILKFLSKTRACAERYVRELQLYEIRRFYKVIKDFAEDKSSAYMQIRRFLQKRRL